MIHPPYLPSSFCPYLSPVDVTPITSGLGIGVKSIKESKIHEGPHSLAGVLMVVTMTTKAP